MEPLESPSDLLMNNVQKLMSSLCSHVALVTTCKAEMSRQVNKKKVFGQSIGTLFKRGMRPNGLHVKHKQFVQIFSQELFGTALVTDTTSEIQHNASRLLLKLFTVSCGQ